MTALEPLTVKAAVVGAGPSGLLAAIALAAGGIETALLGNPAPADHRTTALMSASVTALDTLGVWDLCRDDAAPLRTLRIADDTARLLRAPEARFEAEEIGLPAFAYNIENRHLVAALEKRARDLPKLTRIEENAKAVDVAQTPTIVLECDRTLSADLIVGADGARSLCRVVAGIEMARREYPQHALTFNIRHTRPHSDISTEFHTESGPFTLVPLPGLRSSIVCVVDPHEAERLRQLADVALADEIEARSHSILGKITLDPGRGFFPLAVETANSFAARRIALVGEAAHRLPPIGAQGLNLGLRDAATIAELAVEAERAGGDIGGSEVLSRYDTQRRTDVTARKLAVDLLNRSLLSDFLPAQGARGLGLYLMNRIGSLRRAVMREGVDPAVAKPRLMRGEALR
ncbi:MAG TPA: UbiH/UbiF family hydroxylase [Pseudorhodoplanes sp.]|nr:UbiH/UbiF family hydroxylase [Pseudorhodoplanes sp.]